MADRTGTIPDFPKLNPDDIILTGDLAKLTPAQRAEHYRSVCTDLSLNPRTRPFEYITLNGKLVLYATKNATDQLRRNLSISCEITSEKLLETIYVMGIRTTMPDGRFDDSTGAVGILGLKGDALANAYMKCESKGKRRSTLSIVGLGFLDETEVETIPGGVIGDPAEGPTRMTQATPRETRSARPVPPIVVSPNLGGNLVPAGEPVAEQPKPARSRDTLVAAWDQLFAEAKENRWVHSITLVDNGNVDEMAESCNKLNTFIVNMKKHAANATKVNPLVGPPDENDEPLWEVPQPDDF